MATERQLIDLNDIFPNNMMPVITGDPWLTLQKLLDRINKAPVIDAVEVVRCRDCTYWEKAHVNNKGFLICPASGMEITPTDFCSYGERRTDNG